MSVQGFARGGGNCYKAKLERFPEKLKERRAVVLPGKIKRRVSLGKRWRTVARVGQGGGTWKVKVEAEELVVDERQARREMTRQLSRQAWACLYCTGLVAFGCRRDEGGQVGHPWLH